MRPLDASAIVSGFAPYPNEKGVTGFAAPAKAVRLCVTLAGMIGKREIAMKLLSALTVGLILSGPALAQAEDVALDCRITQTCKLDDSSCSGTTGSEAWIISYENGDITNLTIPFACSDITPTLLITDTEIRVECTEVVTGSTPKIANVAIINRVSGEYFHSLRVGYGSGGIIHFGQCNAVDRKF